MFAIGQIVMIGGQEADIALDRALATGEAFVLWTDEYCFPPFPVATADEQVATFCYGVDSTLLLEKTT